MMILKKNIFHLITLFYILLLIASCAAPVSDSLDMTPRDFKYVIGPEDKLRIYVWKQPDLSLSIQVRIDGKISLPLINDVQAAGLTPEQLKDEISKKLSRFIEAPTVSVIVDQINSLKIVVQGNVLEPGVKTIQSPITLLEAISLAGGLGEWANPKRVKIIRKEGNQEKTFIINYRNIMDGKDSRENIPIYPGDTIIVP